MHVRSLLFYPVKSCAGINLTTSEIGLRGIKNDRIFMLVDNEGTFLTQRKCPKMALVRTALREGILTLRSNRNTEIEIK